jgi:Domain of unknown function (DUF1996)
MREVMILAVTLIFAVVVATACAAEAQSNGSHEATSSDHIAHDFYLKYQEDARKMKQGAEGNEELSSLHGAQIAAIGPDARTMQIGCEVWKTDAIDPIVDPPVGTAHLHDFIGNLSTNADSTFESLVANKSTSCATPSYTSADWFPDIRERRQSGSIPVLYANVYYTGDGAQAQYPDGLQLIAMPPAGDIDYRCGARNGTVYEEPAGLIGCQAAEYRIRVQFPNCYDGDGLTVYDEPGKPNTIYESRQCPSSHPIEFHQTRVAIHYQNVDRKVTEILVSAGAGEWRDISYMHADIFSAFQPEFRDLLDLCGVTQPQSGTMPTECRTGNP